MNIQERLKLETVSKTVILTLQRGLGMNPPNFVYFIEQNARFIIRVSIMFVVSEALVIESPEGLSQGSSFL